MGSGGGSSTVKIEKGLTWRSFLALAFASLVIQPALIYNNLVLGTGLAMSTWLVLIIITTVASMAGRPLTRQETFIIYAFESMAMVSPLFFLAIIKNMYFASDPVTEQLGLTAHIPAWFAPPRPVAMEIFGLRTFFHPSILLPILIPLIGIALITMSDIAMGYFSYQLYVQVEKLDFPRETAAAQAIVTISEKEAERTRVLMLSALLGIVYNLFTWFLGAISGFPLLRLIPREFVDFTSYIEPILPGASFGLWIDIHGFLPGMLLPVDVTLAQLIAAFAVYFIGNHLVTIWGLWPPECRWTPGMGIGWLTIRSQLYFWTSAAVGVAIAACIVPMILHPSRLARSFRMLARAGKAGGVSFLWILLALFFIGIISTVALVGFLAPAFTPYLGTLLIFSVGWSFIASFVAAYSAGVTFGGFGVKYLRESVIYFTGYRGFDIWLTPATMAMGGGGICGAFRQADICGVSHGEYIKTYIITMCMAFAAAFIFVEGFWRAAPIPSTAYPITIGPFAGNPGWPEDTISWVRWQSWLWTGYLFKPMVILGSFFVGGALYLLCEAIKRPYLAIALAAGITGWGFPGPASWTGMLYWFIGSLISFVMAKRFGKERWRSIVPNIWAGFAIGDGIMYTLAYSIMLIGKSQWLLPY